MTSKCTVKPANFTGWDSEGVTAVLAVTAKDLGMSKDNRQNHSFAYLSVCSWLEKGGAALSD